jgi:hypothetical protein
MLSRITRSLSAIAVLACSVAFAGTAAAFNCDTTQIIASNTTLAGNYTTTTTVPCFNVTGGVTLNMAGYSIICDRAAGCDRAVQIQHGSGKVRNGNIVSGTGSWNVGVMCYNDVGGYYSDCQAENLYIEDATALAIAGAASVNTTVMVNTPTCIDTVDAITTGGTYVQNYCEASSDAFVIEGPASGD